MLWQTFHIYVEKGQPIYIIFFFGYRFPERVFYIIITLGVKQMSNIRVKLEIWVNLI